MSSFDHAAFIGFGEAAMAFAANGVRLRAYDIKTDTPETADAKRADYHRLGVPGEATLARAIGKAELILSLVTADRALAAAQAAARFIERGALYCDFNSVAPQTKQAAADVIESAGARYADVAVLAPVHPAGLSVALLVSGPHASQACEALAKLGFKPRAVQGPVGRASTVKMLRSVMIKGMEALTAECFLAAHQAGVVGEVAQTLGESWPGVDWAGKADYNLERMMVHGLRRAVEMDEVAETLAALGAGNRMAEATARWQRAIGRLGLAAPDSLAAKSDIILERCTKRA